MVFLIGSIPSFPMKSNKYITVGKSHTKWVVNLLQQDIWLLLTNFDTILAWEFKCIVADNFFRFSRSIITSRKKTLSLLFMLYLLNSQRCSSIRFSAWSTSVLLESNFLFLWRWKLQRFARTIWPFVSQFPVSLTSFPTNGYSLSISKNTVNQNSPKKSHFKKIRFFTPLTI